MRQRRSLRLFLLAVTVSLGVSTVHSFAQEFRVVGKRRIVAQVRPAYPALARKLNISGTVRLQVTIAPAGNVLRSQELGGSPILVRAAVDAVAKTKWEVAEGETKEIVEIKFQPETE